MRRCRQTPVQQASRRAAISSKNSVQPSVIRDSGRRPKTEVFSKSFRSLLQPFDLQSIHQYGLTAASCSSEGSPKPAYGGDVVRGPEDGGTGYERIGSGVRNAADVLHFDAPIYLQVDRLSGGVDASTNSRNLRQHIINEALAAKSGVHAHHQHQIQSLQHIIQPSHRTGRIERDACATAETFDQLDGPIQMAGRLRVNRNDVSAALRKVDRKS